MNVGGDTNMAGTGLSRCENFLFEEFANDLASSSIALGHPWSATGGRIVSTLAYEMARRDARWDLISICAAGAMAGAVLLDRISGNAS